MPNEIDLNDVYELATSAETRYADVVLKNGTEYKNVYIEVVDEFDEGPGIIMNVHGKMIDAVAPEIKSIKVLE